MPNRTKLPISLYFSAVSESFTCLNLYTAVTMGYDDALLNPLMGPASAGERSPRRAAAENRHASPWKQTIALENGASLGPFGRRLLRQALRRSTPRAQRSESCGARELPLSTRLRRSITPLAMTAIGRQPKFKPTHVRATGSS
jgi:hypothetical protein